MENKNQNGEKKAPYLPKSSPAAGAHIGHVIAVRSEKEALANPLSLPTFLSFSPVKALKSVSGTAISQDLVFLLHLTGKALSMVQMAFFIL